MCYCDVLLRYDTAELQEMGGGAECGLWKLQNGIGVFHYIDKDLASAYVLCPRLGTRCLYLRGIRKEEDEESNRGIIFGGIYVDYKLKNIYKVSSPFILQEKGQVQSSNKI